MGTVNPGKKEKLISQFHLFLACEGNAHNIGVLLPFDSHTGKLGQ